MVIISLRMWLIRGEFPSLEGELVIPHINEFIKQDTQDGINISFFL